MNLPGVEVRPGFVALSGGLDRISSPTQARPGAASFASNYESVFGGGYQRAGGIERFDGRPAPSAATYVASAPESTYDVAVGDVVTGLISGAVGTCVYAGSFIAMTKVTGTFLVGEDMQVGGVTKGVNSATDPLITPALDNAIRALAADEYRADILAVPGDGQIRGFAALKGVRYAWRDDGAAMKMYRATSSGWTQVALGSYVSFTSGLAAGIADGDTITGATSGATGVVTRVAVDSGEFAGGTATGRLTFATITGTFQAAENLQVSGTNRATCSGAQTVIAMLAGGRVQTDLYNFTASLDTQRLYGCDGVNPEWEFDGTVYVPLNTGMTTRATAVRCHKSHAFFGFRGSLQHSGIANPYKFTVVSGASELGTGDVVTNLVPVAGSESAAAMLVTCEQSAWALFGNDTSDWVFSPLSRDAGGNAYSAEDCGVILVHDTPGVRAYSPTDRFGNFAWNLQSRNIDPLVQNRIPRASCFSKAFSRYRVFFTDGTAVSGTPSSKGWEWTTLDYGREIVIAWSGEVDGVTRTYYGDDDGFIYEADVGRSFDGDTITAVLKLHGLNQGQPMVEKTYRWAVIETLGESPFWLLCSADFDSADIEREMSENFNASLTGAGALWDSSSYDASFWDTRRLESKRIGISGNGSDIAPICVSQAGDELPHQIKTITLFYTPRRVRRR